MPRYIELAVLCAAVGGLGCDSGETGPSDVDAAFAEAQAWVEAPALGFDPELGTDALIEVRLGSLDESASAVLIRRVMVEHEGAWLVLRDTPIALDFAADDETELIASGPLPSGDYDAVGIEFVPASDETGGDADVSPIVRIAGGFDVRTDEIASVTVQLDALGESFATVAVDIL